MPRALPGWFAADQVYSAADGYYIGSPNGFRVGPYPRKATAESRSRTITSTLTSCTNTGDMVRAVRRFLHDQSAREGRQLGSGEPARAPGVMGSIEPPPRRSGEAARVWFRTSRFFNVEDVWFFATREGIDVGPYESKAAAQRDANRLLEILRNTGTEAEGRLAIYQFKSRPQVYARTV